MAANRLKKIQAAQGMVEFALVLPILLLVIMGIFAFGHLFFAYSSVVSASREAARWGSAVGVADSTQLRYRDCALIRAAAVRVGSFAGVSAVDAPDDGQTPGIYVGFDEGPNSGPDFDDCSDNSGPSNIGYGDRIKVRVTVQYDPIVPLVNIPSFPLTAETARTIIKSLPVGDAPTAEPVCPSTAIDVKFLPNHSIISYPYDFVYGEAIYAYVVVTSSDGSSPTGKVDVMVTDGTKVFSCQANASSTSQPCLPAPLVPVFPNGFDTIGDKTATAEYTPSGCYQPSVWDGSLTVIKASTITLITGTVPPQSPGPGYPVTVSVQVIPTNPGAGTPTGQVDVSDGLGHTCPVFLVGGTGSCKLEPGPTASTNLFATYQGDQNFAGSPPSDPYPFLVIATPICPDPGIIQFISNASNKVAWFQVTNPAASVGGFDMTITGVDVTWPNPGVGGTKLIDIRSITSSVFPTSCSITGSQSSRNCLWKTAAGGELPPSQPINNTNTIKTWYGYGSALTAGSSRYLYMSFTNTVALPDGDYKAVIHLKPSVTGNYPSCDVVFGPTTH